MKEINEKEEAFVCSNELSLLPPDENVLAKSEEKHSEAVTEIVKVELETEEKEYFSKDVTNEGEEEEEEGEDEGEELKEDSPVEKQDEDENSFQRKLILRPRKTEPNPEDGSESRKSKKTERKSAINKEDELGVKVVCDEIIGTEDSFTDSLEMKSEPQNSSENDGGSSENMSIVRSEDSKSKENSESEMRISLQSESNSIKLPKKRRRRRDIRWTKKRKRTEGGVMKDDLGLPLPVAFEWKEREDSGCVNGRRRGEDTQKKTREFAVPSPSLADISMKPAIPESTATSLEASKPNVCLCRKKPQVFISGNNNAGDLYCQALDCIDSRIVGCCNPIPSQDVGLFRSSEKAPYQMLCDVHQQRLSRHNCCPGCGLFCTQGKYLMCKSFHHFHKTCAGESDAPSVTCPHCGDDSPPKSVIVSIHCPKDPVFLPHQKPLRNMKSAKMSITRGTNQVVEEEEPSFQLPASLFALGGEEALLSNGLAHSLHRDKYSYKSLYNASVSGDAEKILKIIAGGLNPNHVFEGSRQTPLHLAAANGHLPAVHILLQAKAQINAMDGEQNTPLTAAINAKHNDVVKYLVKCGADLILKSEDGMTPLHIAAKSGNLGACYHLLNGTHLPPRYIDGLDDGGWTPMVWASEFNHLDVVKFLLTKGADPLIKDAEQNIALHWAAFGGSIDIVEMFLNDGSDINAVNVHGDTPLHIAARQDKYSCVLLLLARGARSDIKNKNGELPRDCSDSPASDIYKGITLNMEISALLTRFQERTPRIISNDISRGKERNQIQCVNGVDDEEEPRDYVYVSESCFTSKITLDRTINSLQVCKCRDTCGSDSCNCATISIKCWYDNDGRLKPEFNYADPPMIFECNQACQCNRITCRNRVVQNGISCRFQLFRTEGKGWGIKTLNIIPKGTYVCEYIGEIISDCEADHREDDSYLFDLDNRDGETYCIDARHYGNFARFINHMCVPNLMPVHVFVDHQDLRFPRIAFFANRDILPEEELGYNYGEKFWVIKWKSFTCTCGAEKCMYSETTIKTTLDNYKKKIEENP